MITLSGSRVLFLLLLLFLPPFPTVYIFPLDAPPHGQLTAIIAGYLSGFASLFGLLLPLALFFQRTFFARTKDEVFVLSVVKKIFSFSYFFFCGWLRVYFWRRLHQNRQCCARRSGSSFVLPPRTLSFLCEFFKTLRPNGVYLTFCTRRGRGRGQCDLLLG